MGMDTFNLIMMASQTAAGTLGQAREARRARTAAMMARAESFQADERAYGFAQQAQRLDESQLELRLQQERIASEEQSVLATEQLRETLANQRAIFAARGQMPGIGSAGAIEKTSVRNYNADEKARALSFGFLEQQRKADMSIGRINLLGMKYGQATNRLNNLKESNFGASKSASISSMIGHAKDFASFFKKSNSGPIGSIPSGDNLW